MIEGRTADDDSQPQAAPSVALIWAVAPKLVHRTAWSLYGLALVLVVASPWFSIMRLPWGWAVTYVAPVPIFITYVLLYNGRFERLKAEYVKLVLDEVGVFVPNDDDRQSALAAFSARHSSNVFQASAFIIFFIYLVGLYGYDFFLRWKFDPSQIKYYFNAVLFAIYSIWAVICAFGFSAIFIATTRYWPLGRDELFGIRGSVLALAPEDRNDVEIAGLGVAIQTLMRRAETYTFESSLLGALAFSAFVGIAFSDQGPLEGNEWTSSLAKMCDFRRLYDCVPPMIGAISNHTMYVVAATLLGSSVFFISTLVIRFRFNEAYKHVEEILAVAIVLNEKESNSTDNKGITTAIDDLLKRAGEGVGDLNPLGGAMKVFRNVGIFLFVIAVSLCGLYFHWLVALFLYLVVIAAYLVSYIDQIRRKIGFLPKLESVVLSGWNKKI